MAKLLIIGCGGVAKVAIAKCCQNSEVFTEICIASRTKSKCDAVKEEVEKPVFKPSPQIFSSVFVDKKEENIVSNNEEEHVTEIKKEQKPMDAKLFSIIDDEDEEDIELPSLKNEEVTNDLDKINGEVYNLK